MFSKSVIVLYCADDNHRELYISQNKLLDAIIRKKNSCKQHCNICFLEFACDTQLETIGNPHNQCK